MGQRVERNSEVGYVGTRSGRENVAFEKRTSRTDIAAMSKGLPPALRHAASLCKRRTPHLSDKVNGNIHVAYTADSVTGRVYYNKPRCLPQCHLSLSEAAD
jgi:hypothetical protein